MASLVATITARSKKEPYVTVTLACGGSCRFLIIICDTTPVAVDLSAIL